MGEKNSFLKHFAIIGGGTFINIALGVFTTPIITRLVDPVEYGQLSIFTMYSGMALMVLCMGLDQALVRFYYDKPNESYKRALLFKCIKFPVLISILISAAVILLSICGFVQLEFQTSIVILLCIYTLIQLIYRFSLLLIRLSYKSKLYSMLNILQKLIYIVTALPLILYVSNNDLLWLIIATMISGVLCMLVSMVGQSKFWNLSKNEPDCCHILISELVRYGYPYIFTMGITTLFQGLDKISLNKYRSYTEVGIYASTCTLINVFAIIQTTFNSMWVPMAVEHYSNDKEDRSFYQKGNQIITVIMFFIGISLILVKDIFTMLLGEKYREAAYILPFLIFNPIMYTISETTVSGLIFMKKSKHQVIVAAGACLANFAGNTLLVPQFGCQGAAISTGMSYIVYFTLRTYLSNKYFYVDFKLKRFYILTFVVAIYAIYNTFVRFSISVIFGYIICLIFIIILYFDTVKWITYYLINMINKNIRKINEW